MIRYRVRWTIVAAFSVACLWSTTGVAQDEEPAVAPPAAWQFSFGSYGRVVGASDLRGGRGKETRVVAHGPRLEESPYLELDFRARYAPADGPDFDTTITLALTDALFHYDGDFDGAIALRNAFVDAGSFGVEGLSLWAGSRMYRGDDIYLLDFWPLDDLNTVGGGLRYQVGDFVLSAHGGVNQLEDAFQYQEIEVAGPGFDTEQLILMDRVRSLASLKLEQFFFDITDQVTDDVNQITVRVNATVLKGGMWKGVSLLEVEGVRSEANIAEEDGKDATREVVFQRGLNDYDSVRDLSLWGWKKYPLLLIRDHSASQRLDIAGVPWGGKKRPTLIRFDGLFGEGSGQMPEGAKVISAKLMLYQTGRILLFLP